jgi:23S rRNA (guanine745-N1)-methyltransferase
VNLLAGTARTGTAGAGSADTTGMVADRVDFLAAGHYAPLADLVAGLVVSAAGDGSVAQADGDAAGDGLVVDAGAGTGYYLAAALDRLPGTVGLAMDLSALALRRAARAHERIGAAVWDVWQQWPVADAVADVLLNVFAPRNGAEFHRVLRPGGLLVVVTPTERHLAELGAAAGLLRVDRRKAERLANTLGERFEQVDEQRLGYEMTLSAQDVRRVVGMGPAGHHSRTDDRIDDRSDEPRVVTTSFVVSVFRAVGRP